MTAGTEKRYGAWTAWAGTIVVFAGVASYFRTFVFSPTLRDFPWVNLPLVLLGAGLSVWGVSRALRGRGRLGKISASISAGLSLLLGGFFLFYIFSLTYSLPESRQAFEVPPPFTLQDQNGREVSLDDYAGRPVILVFYRGHW